LKELENLITSALILYQNLELVEDIFAFQTELNKKIDETFPISLQKEGVNIDCQEGCAYCCYGWEVKGNIAEIIVLINSLNSLKLEIRKEIFQKIKEYPKNSQNLENIPCPLLDLENNLCMVYNSRPFVCRLYVSEDVKKCKNKEQIVFPESVEFITKNIKIPSEEIISDELKPLFNTKISITSINFDENRGLFFLNIANTIELYIYPEKSKIKIEVEKGEYLKKFGN
jgi:Fe-S-cluster containining protein